MNRRGLNKDEMRKRALDGEEGGDVQILIWINLKLTSRFVLGRRRGYRPFFL